MEVYEISRNDERWWIITNGPRRVITAPSEFALEWLSERLDGGIVKEARRRGFTATLRATFPSNPRNTPLVNQHRMRGAESVTPPTVTALTRPS